MDKDRERAKVKIANWLFEKARKEIPELTWGDFYTDKFSLGASWVIDLLYEFRNEGMREVPKDFNTIHSDCTGCVYFEYYKEKTGIPF